MEASGIWGLDKSNECDEPVFGDCSANYSNKCCISTDKIHLFDIDKSYHGKKYHKYTHLSGKPTIGGIAAALCLSCFRSIGFCSGEDMTPSWA